MSPGLVLLRADTWPILLLVPAAAILLWARARARARRVERVMGPRAGALAPTSRRRRRLRAGLAVLALLLALLAILQPAWGQAERTAESRGVDILICLDVSRSMLARDVPPSRLERARQAIRALADATGGDRLGLVLFAGEATRAVPLTSDTDSFAELVARADPLAIGRGGTDLGAALEAALEALAGATGEHEVVLLITDGEDHEGRGARVAATCRDRGITVHTIGLGDPRGAKIVVEEEGAGETFLRDRSGRDVVTTMDAEQLKRIAETTGGTFVDAGETEEPLVELYEDAILPMARKALGPGAERVELENRFPWFLLPACLLWILGLALTDRRRG